jgi:DNA-binding MarR family transcriptional regulator
MAEARFEPGSPYAHLDSVETDFWYSYMKVLLRLRFEMNHQLRRDAGISIADYDVLVALISEPAGRMRLSDLAVRIGWERSRLSHHVAALRTRDLVTTEQSDTDKRSTEVALTATARTLLETATPAHVAFVRQVFLDALSRDELTLMHGSLDRVYDSLIEHGTLPRPDDRP